MRKQNLSTRKVCYFTIVADGDGAVRVRFGFVPRWNSQVEADYTRWQRILKRLRDEGYELIEQPGKTPDGRSATGPS